MHPIWPRKFNDKTQKPYDRKRTNGRPTDEDEDEAIDYSELSAKELYKLCKERDIDVVPKKPAKYYITKLEDDDSKKEDGWDDMEDDEEDEWND